ncbi:hypothetical protein AVEN_155621-1 [Araneus ventricosus]|uniref:Uncharacterized protein n=1 Tax=Araneus ventricosus TaxID=182803 RepID=A0A4Y2P3M1_ARAVE|nr:hypothetical protein AVEN_155621-1 [Araneus ventricosus]
MPFQFKKGETLKSQARKIVHNVAEFCIEEAAAKSLKVPLPQAMKRVSQATGVLEFTIRKIRNEVSVLDETEVLSTPGKHRKSSSHQKFEFDDFDKCVIRQTIQDFYIQQKKVPSLRKIFPVLTKKLNFQWKKESLRKVMHSMNFRWKKCANKRKVLIERPDIVFWRNNYLRKMRQYRKSGCQIVFIVETRVDSNLAFKICWQNFRSRNKC